MTTTFAADGALSAKIIPGIDAAPRFSDWPCMHEPWESCPYATCSHTGCARQTHSRLPAEIREEAARTAPWLLTLLLSLLACGGEPIAASHALVPEFEQTVAAMTAVDNLESHP